MKKGKPKWRTKSRAPKNIYWPRAQPWQHWNRNRCAPAADMATALALTAAAAGAPEEKPKEMAEIQS